jgi:hypothetical protein
MHTGLTKQATLLAALLLAGGCWDSNGAGNGDASAEDGGDTGGDADADADGDADTDSDGDTDADSDADTDSDADSDTDSDGDSDADSDADADSDTDTDSDADADSDADTDADADTDTDTSEGCVASGGQCKLVCPDGTEWDSAYTDCKLNRLCCMPTDTDAPCPGFFDPATGMCWQNPAEDIYVTGKRAQEQYCPNRGWRIPTIYELMSLIRGCPVIESCKNLPQDYTADQCWGCEDAIGEGPDEGCYWDSALEGPCESYWSSDIYVADSKSLVVFFGGALVTVGLTYDEPGTNRVRCVISGELGAGGGV